MADILNLLARALVIFGAWLQELSPFGIPWPLPFAFLFPLFAAALATLVWWWRGAVWPVRCEYTRTTTGHPCRNRVFGEWRSCHHHRPGRWLRTTRHAVPRLYRWQTMRRGKLVERPDIQGRGFLFDRSQRRGLFYYRGFARPPRNVLNFAPVWWSERRDDLLKVRTQLREEGRLTLRTLVTGAARLSARVGVSEKLVGVIRAIRLILVLVLVGLVLVGVAVWQNVGTKHALNYAATLMFVGAWAVARSAIWPQSTPQPRRRRRQGWLSMAAVQTWSWFGTFILVSVVAGGLIDLAARAIRLEP